MFAVDLQASGLSILPDRIQLSCRPRVFLFPFKAQTTLREPRRVVFHQNGN